MKEDLQLQVGNLCLEKAKKLLEKDTVPAEETVETVGKLVDVAIALDELNLRWAAQNRYGAAGRSSRTFRQA